MTRAQWEKDWRDARLGLHMRPPAADLLFCRGIRDPLLIARALRPLEARWRNDAKYMRGHKRLHLTSSASQTQHPAQGARTPIRRAAGLSSPVHERANAPAAERRQILERKYSVFKSLLAENWGPDMSDEQKRLVKTWARLARACYENAVQLTTNLTA